MSTNPIRTALAVALLILGACSHEEAAHRRLVDDLRAASSEGREDALKAAEAPGPVMIEPLAKLLREEDPQLHEVVVRALRRLASRATTDSEREDACDALLEVVADQRLPLGPRQELLRCAGLVADDAGDVERIARWLGDEDFETAALFALERIPGEDASAALGERLAFTGGEPKLRLLSTLAARDDGISDTWLEKHWDDPDPAARRIARGALCDHGTTQKGWSLEREIDAGSAESLDLALRWCLAREGMEKSGDVEALRLAFLRRIGRRGSPAQRCAVLGGLVRCADSPAEALSSEILPALASEEATIRQSALGLGRELGVELSAPLRTQLETIDPASPLRLRALELLLAVDPKAARKPLCAEARSGSFRAEALGLLASAPAPEVEELVQAALQAEDEGLHPAAAGTFEACVRARIAGHEDEAARKLLHRALPWPSLRSRQSRLLRLLEGVADDESLQVVEACVPADRQGEAVARMRLSVAKGKKSSDPEAARRAAKLVLDASRSRSTRLGAARLLRDLGATPASITARSGWLTHWWILAPLPACDEAGLGTQPFGDDAPKFDAEVEGQRWRALRSDDLDGLFDLAASTKPTKDRCAYAACTLSWPRDEELEFRLGSDDQPALWVNGSLVHSLWRTRGVGIDEDRFRVRLRKGPNHLLLKVNNAAGGWGFCLRAFRGESAVELSKAVVAPR